MKQVILIQRPVVFLMILSLLFLISCTNPSNKNKVDTAKKEDIVTKNKPPSSYSDTIKIRSMAAVFYYPDSLQLEKIRVSTDTMIFKSNEHECYYLMKSARTSLKDHWPKVRVIEASKARYLLFIKSDKSQICIDLNTKNDMCGLFLFNLVKGPVLVDMANIGTALDFYFLK